MNSKTILLLTLATCLISCQKQYYQAWEFLGYEKRDLLASEVEKIEKNQVEVKKDFEDVLSRIRHQYKTKDTKISIIYDQLKEDYDKSLALRSDLKKRANNVRRLAKDLFNEWETEAENIQNRQYRRDSSKKLRSARKRFNQLSLSIRSAENRLDEVVQILSDQTIYFKHNLNAQSMETLETELIVVKQEIKQLIQAIEKAINHTQSFQKTMT